MVSLGALWLPIILSAVFVFIASSIVWMVMPHHKKDASGLANEDRVLEALRESVPKPGLYALPYAGDFKNITPEIKAKFESGPVGIITVMKTGMPAIGKSLGIWFAYTLVVSVFVAYLTGHVLEAGTHYLAVFRVAGTAAVLAYAGGLFPESIWWGKPWGVTLRSAIDAVVYGLLTAGCFGWLWPK